MSLSKYGIDSHSAGDHLWICPRCKKQMWYSETVYERHTKLRVCKRCLDEENPQTHLKTVKDSVAVKDGIPEPPVTGTSISTEVAVAGVITDTTLDLDSVSDMSDGDNVFISLDNGEILRTTINGAPAGTVITLTDALPSGVAIDNRVVCYSSLVSRDDY